MTEAYTFEACCADIDKTALECKSQGATDMRIAVGLLTVAVGFCKKATAESNLHPRACLLMDEMMSLFDEFIRV